MLFRSSLLFTSRIKTGPAQKLFIRVKFTGNLYSYVCEWPPLKYMQTRVCRNSYAGTHTVPDSYSCFMWAQPKFTTTLFGCRWFWPWVFLALAMSAMALVLAMNTKSLITWLVDSESLWLWLYVGDDTASLQFYATFWSLSMYDLHVPATAYDKQIQQLKSQISLEDDKDMVCVGMCITYTLLCTSFWQFLYS